MTTPYRSRIDLPQITRGQRWTLDVQLALDRRGEATIDVTGWEVRLRLLHGAVGLCVAETTGTAPTGQGGDGLLHLELDKTKTGKLEPGWYAHLIDVTDTIGSYDEGDLPLLHGRVEVR